MPTSLLRNTHDIIRWEIIFGILSMDIITPYIEEMGLKLHHGDFEVVREISRVFIDKYYQLEDRSEEFSSEKYNKEQEALIQMTFSQISQSIDEKNEKRIYLWGIEYFQWGDSYRFEESRWSLLLRGLAGLWAGEPLPPPKDIREEKVDEIIQAVIEYLGDYMLLHDEFDNLEKQPKSDWDQRIYRTYENHTSPLDAVMLTIDFYHFQCVWRRIYSILSKKEREALLHWGKSNAHECNFEAETLSMPKFREILEDNHS